MKSEETPSTVRWLHRRIFRGTGLVFFIGILTWLYFFFQAGARR